MLKWFNKKKKDNKGFTLVELIIVIAILAILVGLLAPQYTKYVEKSRKSADISNLDNIVEGFKVAAADHEYDLIDDNNTTVEYTIIINKDSTKITSGQTSSPITETDDIRKALKEFTGYDFSKEDDQKSVKLKSKRWGTAAYGTGNTTTGSSSIGAKITVDGNSDAVTVTYSNNVKEYSEKGTVTVTAVAP